MQLLPETVTESPAGGIQRQSGTREDTFHGPTHGVGIVTVDQMGERRTSPIENPPNTSALKNGKRYYTISSRGETWTTLASDRYGTRGRGY
ncbi:hypothetical protein HETIRDRAFT_407432 [Heterobasidion irregulare TC 32-1]|uniref:Uncharacterized protein n=1 Tax=Heterobasidion irregulare (strain TC 32-1) TaxID=747525 RepID=W4KHZ8_HETIT|nr:uncharacterized protein HETIRDRAFT_407432 [Heterobasidion irregulare TC 32-1]ETW85304.1 hypothetical protein HETIRDRAFT_407432 [Heterobasidion irregulare TC 32-1]